jgi:hypothetical protein
MAGLTGNFEDEAVGEAQRRAVPVVAQCALDDLGVLQSQGLVHEQHLDRSRDSIRRQIVHGVQNPDRFCQHEVRDPRTRADEGFRSSDLSRVVTDDQPDEKVRINGAHAAFECTSGYRP